MIARILSVLVALLGLPGALGRYDDDGSRLAIHDVIQRQLAAFQRDDGPAAFDLAAPAVRRKFASPEAFLEMIRHGYPPIHRQRDAVFGPLKPTHVGLTQYVTVTGDNGEVWNALYVVARQADGKWKIAACYLFRSSETAI